MKKAIGNEISVYLKSSDCGIYDVYGILVDVTEETIYVQSCAEIDPEIFIVPKDNIKFCKTKYLPETNRILPSYSADQPKQNHKENIETEEQVQPTCIDVFVNDEKITSIPVPPTFSLDTLNDNILRVIMGNPDVRTILKGKVQKSLEYYPGEVYIEVVDTVEQEQAQEQNDSTIQNSFSMNSGNVATQFLNPSEMIQKLNAAVKRGKKNDNETKM